MNNADVINLEEGYNKYIENMKKLRKLKLEPIFDEMHNSKILRIEKEQSLLVNQINLVRRYFGLSDLSKTEVEEKMGIYEKKRKYAKLCVKYKMGKKELENLKMEYDSSIDENLVGNQDIIDKIREKEREQKQILNEIQNIRKFFNLEIKPDETIQDTLLSDNSNQKETENTEIIEEKIEPDVLLSQKKEEINENGLDIQSIKIIFNAKMGVYEIKMFENGQEKYKLYGVDKELLDIKSDKYNKYLKEYGYGVDFNLINSLKEFDLEYGTSLKEKYIENSLENKIVYDLRKISSSKIFNRKEKKQLKKNINEYCERENVDKIKFSGKKATALIGLGLVATVAATQGIKESKSNNDVKPAVENTTKEQIVSNDKNTEKVESTTEKDVIIDVENKKVDIVHNNTQFDDINLGVGSTVDLNGVDIYYTIFDDSATTNTDLIDAQVYLIKRITVKFGSEVVDVVTKKGTSMEELREKYGPDAEIWVSLESRNPNYSEIGWIKGNILMNDMENVKVK